MAVSKRKLTKSHYERLRKRCKGCTHFKEDADVRDICNMIGWYDGTNINEIIDYVRNCPCNQKCIVKASCRDVTCPDWTRYVGGLIDKRAEERDKKWKK